MLSTDKASRPASPRVRLGEILTHLKGFIQIDDTATYKRCRVQLHAKGVVLRDEIEGALIKTKNQQICRADEFLVAEIDAKVGGYGIVPAELDGAIVSSHYFLFTLHPDMIDPRFLAFYVKTPFFMDQVNAQGSTNYAAIRPQHVMDYTIPLPPLSEQRRIVAKIERLAVKIQEASTLRQQAALQAHSVLNSEINRICSRSRDRLPAGWTWVKLGDLGLDGVDTVQTGPFGAQLHKSDYVPEGRPVLAIGNVQWGRLHLSGIDHVTEAKALELSRYILSEGDVLFTRSGTVGRSAIVMPEADGWLMTGHILRIRVDRSRIIPKYLYYAFRGSGQIQAQIDESVRGATRAGFNTTLLAQVELPLPPLGQQQLIVQHFDRLQASVERLTSVQAQAAAELDALLPSILDKAFRGEL